MALRKGEQLVLFEVDEPETVPAEPATAEPLQPSLFDVVDDVPDQALPEVEQMLASQGLAQRLWPPTPRRVRSGDGRVM